MTKWLTASEQQAWRSWLAMRTLLDDQLNRELQDLHGLSLADYEILVRLSEAADRRLRMSDLASATLASRSRLSHQIDRLESAGIVQRMTCSEDRRGSFAVLTDHGWQVLVAAAPDHVAGVRRHFVDVLGTKAFTDLGKQCAQVAEQLCDADATSRQEAS
ncbi:MAG: MarR family winged helix-turn-helix transcriptional regulator [Actinomycetales bacterium]